MSFYFFGSLRSWRCCRASAMTGFVLVSSLFLQAPLYQLLAQEKQAEERDDNTGKDKDKEILSFSAFLEETLRNDPSFERILLRSLYLKYNKALSLPPDDLLMDVRGEYGFFRNNDGSFNNDDSSATVSLGKMFSKTGTEAEISYSRISAVTTGVTRYQSTLNLQVSQDILRNAFGRSTRLLADKVEVQTEIARYQVIEAYEDYLATLLTFYLEWHRAEERRKAAEKTLEEENQVYKLTLRKRRLGVAYPDETGRAKLAVLTAEQALEQARTEEDNRRLQIALIMGRTSSEGLVSTVVDFGKAFGPVQPGRESEKSRTLKILELLKKEGVLQSQLASDALLPSAKLFAGYDMLSPTFNLERPDHKVYVGASFELNFTQNRLKAREEVSRLDEKDISLKSRETLLDLDLDLRRIGNLLLSHQRILELSRERLEVARTVARQLQKKYNLGQADISDLASARRNLVQARVNLVEQTAIQAQYQLEQRRIRDQLVHKLPQGSK